MSLSRHHQRYLRLLAIDGLPAGLEGLQQLVHRHLLRVPFENVSKLLLLDAEGAGRATVLSEFLDGIEHMDLGGTCYTNNPFLAELLLALGYDTDLLGADMARPNVHTSIRVRLDGVAYHVDVGYGAPFRQPMPLDQLPQAVVHGNTRYVLDRAESAEGHSMTVYLGGEKVHGYVVHGPPRSADFFRPIILDSYVRGSTFTSSLRITRFFDDGVVELKGRNLTSHRAGRHSETVLRSATDLVSAVTDSLVMPRCPIEKAVRTLERITGKPFFAEDTDLVRAPEGS
jgi:N-hydroxyarylamine O-acetyltransferase